MYCAAGGIAPHRVLPVTIDVGTDNEELLNDEFYLGLQHKRIKGREYFEIVDEFMQAVKHRWPNALVQFEDFRSDVAQPLLNNYRETHLCFNDDIQGTGATTLAGCLGSLRATGQDVTGERMAGGKGSTRLVANKFLPLHSSSSSSQSSESSASSSQALAPQASASPPSFTRP